MVEDVRHGIVQFAARKYFQYSLTVHDDHTGCRRRYFSFSIPNLCSPTPIKRSYSIGLQSPHPLIDNSTSSWWWCERVGKVDVGYGGPTESVLSLMRMPERSRTYNRGRISPTPIQTIRGNLPWSLVPFVPLKHSHVCFSRLALSKVGTLSEVVSYAMTM